MNMQRLEPYLGFVIAVLLGIFLAALTSPASSPQAPSAQRTASSTLAVVPTLTLPPISVPGLEEKADTPVATSSTQATATPEPTKKKIAAAPATSTSASPPVTSVAKPVAAPTPPPLASSGDVGLDATAATLRSALVNIICYAPPGSNIHSISGSGVVIDPKGIILTNAHIAQYFLLTDLGVSCTIRTGSPAVGRYGAALIYISPLWLRANATAITQAAPSGTGEYDFALLAINRSVLNAPLPTTFASIPLAGSPPNVGTPIVIATYGAQFLEVNQIQSSLFPTLVFGSVKDVFTFKSNTIDVLALGGSAAAQEGSSGGGVASAQGELTGTITTSTVTGDTSTRSVSAITASYIRAEYAGEMSSALDLLLAEPTTASIADFATKIPTLEAILTANLPK